MLQTFPNESIYAPDVADASYVRYYLRAAWLWRTGVVQMAVAGADTVSTLQAGVPPPAGNGSTPPATCSIVRVSKPWGKLVVRFDIIRRRLQPQLPAPASDDENKILLSAKVVEVAPVPLPDALNQTYRWKGVYRFALLAPIDGSAGFPGISIPATTLSRDANSIPLANVVGGII